MTKQTNNTLSRTAAKQVMWEYYDGNKTRLPKWIRECREEILERLMAGDCAVEIFDSLTESEV